MPIPIILTTLALLLLAGGAFFMALVYSRRARIEMETRVGLISRHSSGAVTPGGTPSETTGSARNEERAAAFRHWLSLGIVHTWGMRAQPPLLCTLALGGGAAGWLLLHTGLHFPLFVAGPATLAMFLLIPRMWLKHEQNGANQKFVASFPEAIDMMVRMLRAGLPVTATIRAIGAEAAPPVNRVFAHIADQMEIGIAFEDALSVAGEQVGLPDFRFFAVAISLQRTTGGNLASTLGILADIMRQRRAMRQKARAVTGEVRMSAYVLGGIPFLVIGAMLVVAPDYLRPLMTDRRGNIIVGIAVIMMAAGFGTIRMMLRSVTQA